MSLDPIPEELATARAAKRTMELAMTEAATRFVRETGLTIDSLQLQHVHKMGQEGPDYVMVTAEVRKEIVL